MPTYPSNLRWVDPAQVAADARLTGLTMPSGITVDAVVGLATTILFLRSGSRFSQTIRTERPCHLSASCGNRGLGLGAFGGSGWGGAVGGWFDGRFPEGWGCGHSVTEYVLPSSGPVLASTVSVVVDGVTLIPQGSPGEQWHLYNGRRLVRVQDPVSGTFGAWPCCQALSRPLGQQGTFSVTFTTGGVIDGSASAAAWDLSIELCLAFGTKTGKLPPNAVRANRQGVQIDLEAVTEVYREALPSRIANLWLAAINPHGLTRSASVTSVDRVRGFSG